MNKLLTVNEVLPAVNMEEVEIAVKKIQTSWTKTIDALIETSKFLHNYSKSPDSSVIRKTLHERRIIDISVQDILVSVGGNPTLIDSQFRKLLPPHYSNLGFLSRIKGDKLIELFKKKEITPATTLADAKTLALKFGNLKKPQKPRDKKNKPTKVSLQITIKPTVDEEGFIKMVVDFIEQYEGVSVKVNQ